MYPFTIYNNYCSGLTLLCCRTALHTKRYSQNFGWRDNLIDSELKRLEVSEGEEGEDHVIWP